MIDEEQKYTTIVIYGKDNNTSVQDEPIFREVIHLMQPWLDRQGPAKMLGNIYTPIAGQRILSPRKSKISEKTIDDWIKLLNTPGYLLGYTLFLDELSKDSPSRGYGYLERALGYDCNGYYPEVDKYGYTNILIVVIYHIEDPADLDSFVALFERLGALLNALYGFIELNVPWLEGPTFSQKWIPERHREVVKDYAICKCTMIEFATRLHQYTILNSGQILSEIPSSLVAYRKSISANSALYKFIADPQQDLTLLTELREYIPAPLSSNNTE